MELGLVEQRYKAVLEVLEGATSVTEVARRYGVSRQTVHKWLGSWSVSPKAPPAVDNCASGDLRPWRRRRIGSTIEVVKGGQHAGQAR